MSLQTLELEKLHLTLAAEKLKLDIASAVDIRFPSRWIPSQDDDEIVKALTSGHIWVSRGRRCRVDIEVSFNGKPLDGSCRIGILESLGCHLRDAHLWSQLSLSASLEIPQSHQATESATDLSIYINHGTSSAKTPPKAWLLDNIDIKAPETVLCAEFERLELQLSFQRIQKASRTMSKRVKSCPPDPDPPDLMLLDYIPGMEEEAQPTCVENVVAVLRDELSNSITKCFGEFKINNPGNTPKLLDKMLRPLNDKASNSKDDVTPTADSAPVEVPGKRRRGQPFLKETQEKLLAWLDAHPGNMSPTNAEKLELMKQTGLQRDQLYGWFTNARRRNKSLKEALEMKELVAPQTDASLLSEVLDENDHGGILLSNLEDEILFDEKSDCLNEDGMLLSRTTSTTPSLTSQCSTIPTISPITSLKRPAKDEIIESTSTSTPATLPLNPANKLSNLALHTLIGGPSNRKRDLQGIQIHKPPPSTGLSILVPSMFCPCFKELMAHNSKFLPTISNAISSSWVRNVQGVGLRQRLVALSNAKVSDYSDGEGEDGSVGRLVAVVQARLWKMMQTRLYEEGAVKKLWRKDDDVYSASTTINEDEGGDEDLLGQNGAIEDDGIGDASRRNFEDFIGGEFLDSDNDLFDDLLGEDEESGSDDGLLGYLEEQERMAVETETDEMLFGPGCDGRRDEEVEEDPLLLEDSSEEESMLL